MKRILTVLLFVAFAFQSCQKAFVEPMEDTLPGINYSPLVKNDDAIYPTGENENIYWINDTTWVVLGHNSWDYHIVQNCLDFPVVMTLLQRTGGKVDTYSLSPEESVWLLVCEGVYGIHPTDKRGVVLDFGTYGTLSWQDNSNEYGTLWVENHPGWYDYFLLSATLIGRDYEIRDWHPVEEWGWDEELNHDYKIAYPFNMIYVPIDEKLMEFLQVKTTD